MLVHAGVDGRAPDGGLVVGEHLCDVVDAFRRSDDAGHMDALRRALGEKSLVSQLHAAACSEHRVCYDEVLLIDARRGEVLDVDAYLMVLGVGILTVGRHEGVSRVVEHIQEAVVEGQSGAEVASTILSVGTFTLAMPNGVAMSLAS